MTDAEILDWMEREGLECIWRCPQFDREGNSLGIVLWTNMWERGEYFASLRKCAESAMKAARNAR